jgi:hypothetical protein
MTVLSFREWFGEGGMESDKVTLYLTLLFATLSRCRDELVL